MTTWKDGGPYGRYCRGVYNEEDSSVICYVWTKKNGPRNSVVDWPEGEANFRLILQAPQMLEVLERMIEAYEAHFEPLPDGQQPEGIYTQARAAIAAVKEEKNTLA